LEDNQHLAIGHKISNHYEIIKVLGQGGFGIVYLVKDIERLDSLFVIKELFLKELSYRSRDETTVYNRKERKKLSIKVKKDIKDEVIILSEISNKNIVQAYGYIEENNTIYSIMEYIDGIDLEKYLENNIFTEEDATELLLQLINGLEEIHSKNIIHRDIKPNNIIKDKNGIYKIIDFTTNRTYTDNSITTVTGFNNPLYTPPELSSNKKSIIGNFSDIYSLGMTIYRVLSKEELPNLTDRLFDDTEKKSKFQKNIEDLECSLNFKKIITKMTNLRPEDRFQNLEELKISLSEKKDDISKIKEIYKTVSVSEDISTVDIFSFDNIIKFLKGIVFVLFIVLLIVFIYLKI